MRSFIVFLCFIPVLLFSCRSVSLETQLKEAIKDLSLIHISNFCLQFSTVVGLSIGFQSIREATLLYSSMI